MGLDAIYKRMDVDLDKRLRPLMGIAKSIVHGQGPENATMMLIGEAPGRDEDELDEPFCGRCGDLLTKMLADAGIDRAEVFITNVVKCRPTSPDGKKNRPPHAEEIRICKRWLWEEIQAVKPKVIMTLGKVPTSLLLQDKKSQMKEVIGQVHKLSFCDIVIPNYHPSFIMVYGKEYMAEAVSVFSIGKAHASSYESGK